MRLIIRLKDGTEIRTKQIEREEDCIQCNEYGAIEWCRYCDSDEVESCKVVK